MAVSSESVAMRNLLIVSLAFAIAFFAAFSWKEMVAYAQSGDSQCPPLQNGNVNNDQSLDISDVVYTLFHLFMSGPDPVPAVVSNAECTAALLGQLTTCKSNFEESQKTLAGREAELAATKTALAECQAALSAREIELANCRTALNRCEKVPILPTTGQTKCYDDGGNEIDCASTDFPGQDGFYQKGCPKAGRFIDNGDGTVTDTCTLLVWQKDTAPGRYSWQAALQYCNELELAGATDWRLPNVLELHSIVDFGVQSGPPIDIAAFPNTEEDFYWSSTTFLWGSEADAVAFGFSGVYYADHGGIIPPNASPKWFTKKDPFYVRAVRGRGTLPSTNQKECYDDSNNLIDCSDSQYPGQDGFYQSGCPTEDRFIDNNDGTVTDKCTGLMWQKSPSSQVVMLTFQEVLQYAVTSTASGYTDWRIPNLREATSIMDIQTGFPSAYTALLPACCTGCGCLGWATSTSRARDPSWYWLMDTQYSRKSSQRPIWLVRGP